MFMDYFRLARAPYPGKSVLPHTLVFAENAPNSMCHASLYLLVGEDHWEFGQQAALVG